MKWLRTIVLFDQADVIGSEAWKNAHKSYVRAIKIIDNPRGTGALTLRRISADKSKRNGVSYLKTRFVEHMRDETWLSGPVRRLRRSH